jgi:hypothetical protein
LLLEPQRSNLALYSEQFGTASYWFANNSTITSNNAVSPDGYTNADMYTAAGNGNYLNASATSTGSNTVTFSVFAKAGTAGPFRIREAFYFGTSTVFNLATGTIISGTGTITNYGNGWYRCTHTQAYGAGETSVSFTYDLNGAVSGTAYLWGAQAEVGAYATSYIPTLGTSVTRVADAASKTGISSLIGQTEGTLFMEFNSFAASYPLSVLCSVTNGNASKRAYAEILGTTLTMGFIGSASNSATSTIASGTNKVAIAYKNGDIAFYHNGVLKGTGTANVDWAGGVDIFNTYGLYYFNPTYAYNEKEELKQALVFKTRLTNAQLAELTA